MQTVKLTRYLKPYILPMLLAPLFMCLEVYMDLLQPDLMAKIIDVGIANGDMHYILQKLGSMLLVAFVGMIGGICCSIFSGYVALSFGTDLRSHLFKKVQSFSFQPGPFSDLLSHYPDDQRRDPGSKHGKHVPRYDDPLALALHRLHHFGNPDEPHSQYHNCGGAANHDFRSPHDYKKRLSSI